jgi:hypothetical protein
MAGKEGFISGAGKWGSNYAVRKGKIYDEAGVEVSPAYVANDAKRAAKQAIGNAETSRGFAPAVEAAAHANQGLMAGAQNADYAIRKAKGLPISAAAKARALKRAEYNVAEKVLKSKGK